jgi:hypothetical protein
MPDETKRKRRVLVWDSVPPEEVREDKPVSKLFEPRNEPKAWDRASITINTHPLHREPRLGPEDLRLPRRSSRMKLAGDAVAITVLICLAFMFPIWIAGVLINSDLRWGWAAAAVIAVVCGALVFSRGVSDEHRPAEEFLKENP